MLRRNWRTLAGATTGLLVVSVPAYYYFKKRDDLLEPSTFQLPIKELDSEGNKTMVLKNFPLLSKHHVDLVLRESESIASHKNWRWSVSRLASNAPIEDAHSSQVISRDDSDPSAPGDYMFFSVFDGHAGFQTSQLLSRSLYNAVALHLAPLARVKYGWLGWVLPSFRKPLDSDPNQVSSAIQDSFRSLDQALVDAPVHYLMSQAKGLKEKEIPDLRNNPMARRVIAPALSGSCALMAVLDTAHSNLYVACTGDCRAVAGYYQEDESGSGKWRVEVLTQDQTGRNPDELKRMQKEHPGEEANVIRNGRVLGGLEPTRAFGDARYKWSEKTQVVLKAGYFGDESPSPMRPPPKAFKTPPYVTAEPVMTHRTLSRPSPSESKNESLRFLVLATDGLWDRLSSEEVVSLVAGHLKGLKGNMSESELKSLIPTSQGSPTVEGKDQVKSVAQKTWSFEDTNLSTHLIRNAMGGGDNLSLRRLLSIPAPFARRYRDDVTVQCIWWDPEDASAGQTDDTVKSKM